MTVTNTDSFARVAVTSSFWEWGIGNPQAYKHLGENLILSEEKLFLYQRSRTIIVFVPGCDRIFAIITFAAHDTPSSPFALLGESIG